MILYNPDLQCITTPETQATVVQVKDCRATTDYDQIHTVTSCNVKISVDNFINLMRMVTDVNEDLVTAEIAKPVTVRIPQPIRQAAAVLFSPTRELHYILSSMRSGTF
jgi:hypothetical protein